MGEKITFENGRFSGFQGLVTVCIPSCITHRPRHTYQISRKSKKRFVDRRTDKHLRHTLLGWLGGVDLINDLHLENESNLLLVWCQSYVEVTTDVSSCTIHDWLQTSIACWCDWLVWGWCAGILRWNTTITPLTLTRTHQLCVTEWLHSVPNINTRIYPPPCFPGESGSAGSPQFPSSTCSRRESLGRISFWSSNQQRRNTGRKHKHWATDLN